MPTEIHGPLEVDATRGKYQQFNICGRQIYFGPECFEIRNVTANQLYDTTAPPNTIGRILSKKGRELYLRFERLGGKGVTVTGEEFHQPVRYTHELVRQQPCITVTDIRENPECNPVLEPMLVNFLAEKEARDRQEEEKKLQEEVQKALRQRDVQRRIEEEEKKAQPSVKEKRASA